MENTIKYKDYFTIMEYYKLVDDIVDGFWSEDGSYIPHIGDMNAMWVFFTDCVLNKEAIVKKELKDVMEADKIFSNQDFIETYNQAISFDGEIKYDFANAFKNAMEIIQFRVSSPQYALSQITNSISSMVESINSVMSEDNINNLMEFAKNVSDGKYDAKAVSDAFAESEAFKKIAELDRGE